MIGQLKKHLCPFCFEYYSVKKTPFRCINQPSRCAPEPDQVLEEFWDDKVKHGKIIYSPGKYMDEIACPDCKLKTNKRLCPNCHMELPPALIKNRNLSFAIIGAKASGKSHYITVLFNTLMNHVGLNLGMLVEKANEDTMNRYKNNYYDTIFEKNQTLELTREASTNLDIQKPLLFTFTFGKKGMFNRRVTSKVITLAFYDTAGEDLKSQDTMAKVNKYIYRSDGIILLLDPLQIDSVRNQLKGKVDLPDKTTETSDIITRTSNLIRSGKKLSNKEAIKTPIALAFSKFDAVKGLLNDQLQLNQPSNHEDGLDFADFTAVNDEMQSLLSKWQGDYIIQQVTTHFRTYAFFGLSALGCEPVGSRIPRIMPFRVEDPILWLLHNHKLIKTSN